MDGADNGDRRRSESDPSTSVARTMVREQRRVEGEERPRMKRRTTRESHGERKREGRMKKREGARNRGGLEDENEKRREDRETKGEKRI